MKLPKDQLEPIMSNSENIVGFGPNAYSKPATGMNILRETVMGRELFDYAFKEYARRWAFKHPTPADLFRTMEDASGEDLDWFWRGWFFGTDACDIAIDTVKFSKPDLTATPPAPASGTVQRSLPKAQVNSFDDISKIRNREDKSITFLTDADTTLRDFYWRYDRGLEPYDTTKYSVPAPQPSVDALDEDAKAKYSNKNLYEISFSNKGGLPMPIIVEFTFKDGTKQTQRIPAQIWRLNEKKVTKVFVTDKEVASIKLDPMRETADIDESNNGWNNIPEPSKFQLFKQKQGGAARGQSSGINPMQKAEEKKKGF
jgi:hypothetical protein